MFRDARPAPASWLSSRALGPRVLPWLLLPPVMVWIVADGGIAASQAWKFLGYWVAWVIIPGTVITRVLLPGRRGLEIDLALGTAAGTALAIGGWIATTALASSAAMAWWPLIAMPFGVFGRRRVFRWAGNEEPALPALWSWVVCGVAGYLLYATGAVLNPGTVPPDRGGNRFYVDLLYHLSIQHELARDFPPQIPQVAGEPLRYHWFADALVVLGHQITGIDLATVFMRLWTVPLALFLVLGAAALATVVSRVWWAGPLAAVALLIPVIRVASDGLAYSRELIMAASPSHCLVTPMLTAAALGLVVLLRARRRPTGLVGGALWLLIVLGGIAGAKPNGLPTVAAGLAVVVAGIAVFKRRPALRALLAGSVAAGFGWWSFQLLAGSTSGSQLRAYGVLRQMLAFQHFFGPTGQTADQGWLVRMFGPHDLRAYAILLLLIVLDTAALGALLLVLGCLRGRRLRLDPAYWLLAGMVAGALVVRALLDHPDFAETYFARAIRPIALALGAAVVGHLCRRRRSRRWLVLPGVAFGFGWMWVCAKLAGPAPTGSAGGGALLVWLAAPVAAWLAGWLLLAALWRLCCRVFLVGRVSRAGRMIGSRRLAGTGIAFLAAGLLGTPTLALTAGFRGTPPPPDSTAGTVTAPPTAPPPVNLDDLTPGRLRAAAWLAVHTHPFELIATNSFCRPPGQRNRCDARSMWISGLSGRRVWLEGWAYTDQAFTAAAVTRPPQHHFYVPAPWPQRYTYSRAAAELPSYQAMDILRGSGVRWLVVDARSSLLPIRYDLLAQRADEVFSSGEISIYRIRDDAYVAQIGPNGELLPQAKPPWRRIEVRRVPAVLMPGQPGGTADHNRSRERIR